MRCVKKCHRDLHAAKSHSQRRGYALTLVAHLQQFLDEPEFLTDLCEGTVEASKGMSGPEIDDDAPFTGQWPFERVGECQDLFFFLTSGGSLSQLYTGPVIDPYQVPHLWHQGFFAHSLEQLYCTTQETTHHLTSSHLLDRLVSDRKGAGEETPFWVIADPQGLYGGRTEVLKCYSTQAMAIRAADRMASRLGIRFLVGRLLISHCTR